MTTLDIRSRKASLAPGYRATRGSEGGEGEWYSFFPDPDGGSDTAQFFARNFWSYMVYDKANLDIASLDLARASRDAQLRLGAPLNAVSPDLKSSARGWQEDHPVPRLGPTPPFQRSPPFAYYESVERYLRGDIRDFYRLFMVPGMGHCHGGAGPNTFGGAYAPEDRSISTTT